MNAQTATSAYEAACRRYLEVQAIKDVDERIYENQKLRHEFVAAFACLHQDSSDPAVWHALGDAYSKGWGTTADREQALRWFRQAANAGHAKSMVRLGNLLNRPPPDGAPTEAIQWFRRAAELGNASGMIFLGFAYREGTGVPCDQRQAVDWFIKAVEAGDDHSMIHAGRMYSRNLQRPAEVMYWFSRAAEAGQTESQLESANAIPLWRFLGGIFGKRGGVWCWIDFCS